MFNLQLYPTTEFGTIQTEEGRFYETPVGLLPSVTTVLERSKDKTQLIKWRTKVGNKEADAVVRQSRTRGITLHAICENYLGNKEWKNGVSSIDMFNVKPILKILEEYVENVYGLELLLWSEKLKLAGRADALVSWKDGQKYIMDFKTSARPVDLVMEKVYFYKLQATMYAMMAEEQYMIDVPNCSILISQNVGPLTVTFKNAELRDTARKLIQD